MKGSLTVEAALVLPLFLSALLLLSGLFGLLETYEQIDMALCQTARQLGAYSRSSDGIHLLEAYQIFETELAAADPDTGDITGGRAGIILTLSEEDGGWFTLNTYYNIRLPGFLLAKKGILLTDGISFRCFTGLDRSGGGDGDGDGSQQVYLAETGTVYHTHADCTYLKLSIKTVSMAQLAILRNNYGSRYKACELCASHASGDTIYITSMGDAWHTDINCSGLKRSFESISLSEAEEEGLHECSRCKQRDSH